MVTPRTDDGSARVVDTSEVHVTNRGRYRGYVERRGARCAPVAEPMGQWTVCVSDHDRASGRPATSYRDLVRRTGRTDVGAFRRPRACRLGANLRANAQVTAELGGESHAGEARVLQPGTAEEQRACALLVGKYRAWETRDAWGRTDFRS
jgi:hypothetical protein